MEEGTDHYSSPIHIRLASHQVIVHDGFIIYDDAIDFHYYVAKD